MDRGTDEVTAVLWGSLTQCPTCAVASSSRRIKKKKGQGQVICRRCKLICNIKIDGYREEEVIKMIDWIKHGKFMRHCYRALQGRSTGISMKSDGSAYQ